MLAVFRNWKNKQAPEDVERIRQLLKEKLSSDNLTTLEWVHHDKISTKNFSFTYFRSRQQSRVLQHRGSRSRDTRATRGVLGSIQANDDREAPWVHRQQSRNWPRWRKGKEENCPGNVWSSMSARLDLTEWKGRKSIGHVKELNWDLDEEVSRSRRNFWVVSRFN